MLGSLAQLHYPSGWFIFFKSCNYINFVIRHQKLPLSMNETALPYQVYIKDDLAVESSKFFV